MRSKMEMFDFYKKDLMKIADRDGHIRMNVIEYICQFPNLDPVLMAKELVRENTEILFDDSSIPYKENERKKRLVMKIDK